jgi:hypothetical protein
MFLNRTEPANVLGLQLGGEERVYICAHAGAPQVLNVRELAAGEGIMIPNLVITYMMKYITNKQGS